MLDERSTSLLNYINEKCAEGSYKIFSVEELVEDFPLRYGADADLIRQIVTALSTGGYISLKFDRDEEFCIAPTPKGREYFEVQADNAPTRYSRVSLLLPHLYNYLTVFLGTLSAGLLIWLLVTVC